jgi:hypothetical protein
MANRKHELIDHALVGGLVVVLLTSFHELTEIWIRHAFGKGGVSRIAWAWAGLILGGFLAGFLGTVWLDTYLERRRSKEPIRLEDVGRVDGLYMDAIVENQKITAGSIVDIASSIRTGFTVTGRTFEFESGKLNIEMPPNRFEGRHGAPFARNGISYGYKGELVARPGRARQEHFGVVYYQFVELAGERTCFVGAFLAREERATCHVIGKMLPKDLSDREANKFLKMWIENEVLDDIARLPRELGAHLQQMPLLH